MSKTSTKSSTPFGTAATSAGPTGTRPPTRPDTGLIVVRCVLLLAIVVMTARPFVVEWAVAQPPLAVLREAALLSGRPVPATTRALSTVAAGVRGLYLPPGLWAIAGLIALGAVVLVVELLLNLVLLVLQTQRMARQPQSYLRIRTPQPGAGSRSAGAVDGDDLFHTLHRLLPHYGTHTGAAPWLTLLLHARPDEPVEFGVALSGGTTTQRASWMATIRKIVSGSEPNALVDTRPDPLLAALQPGSIVYWRELTALHPPAYPLRLSDAADGDLLSPIVAALRGRLGASYSEYQVIVRPRHDWDLTNGWRVYALRRLLKLRAHHQYFLNPDMQALQTKIDSPAYDVTLRVVSVARDRSQVAAAQSELAEITAILLGQYQARSGTRLQRLLVVGGGQVTVPPPIAQTGCRRLPYQLLPLVAAVSAAAATNIVLTWLAPSVASFVPHLQLAGLQGWASFLSLVPGFALLTLLLPTLGLVGSGLLAAGLIQHRLGQLARIRLRRLVTRPPRATPLHPLLLPLRAWWMPAVLSAVELGGLWHLPTPALGTLVRWLPCRFLPAPPHAFFDPLPVVHRRSWLQWLGALLFWRWREGRSTKAREGA